MHFQFNVVEWTYQFFGGWKFSRMNVQNGKKVYQYGSMLSPYWLSFSSSRALRIAAGKLDSTCTCTVDYRFSNASLYFWLFVLFTSTRIWHSGVRAHISSKMFIFLYKLYHYTKIEVWLYCYTSTYTYIDKKNSKKKIHIIFL